MEYILQTFDLTKRYKNINVVDKLSMNLKKGEIYGFLGQNGAGKTTTIRMIMGLIKKTSGNINLFGKEKCNNLNSRIGSIIEYPGNYLNLTAKENLEIHRRMVGIQEKASIEEVLKLVGLNDIKNKKVAKFSLGMKQRLGIARTLLHKPEFLVLDEPTNGLDPVGIKEIRELILSLCNKMEITILISSHILSEIQHMASKIGIIHKGVLLEEIDLATIEKRNQNYLNIKVNNTNKATFVIENTLGIKKYTVYNDGQIRIYEKLDDICNVNKVMVANDIEISELIVKADNLEDYYLKMIGGD